MDAKVVPYICILRLPCESNVYSVSDILVRDKISNSFLPTIVEPYAWIKWNSIAIRIFPSRQIVSYLIGLI